MNYTLDDFRTELFSDNQIELIADTADYDLDL